MQTQTFDKHLNITFIAFINFNKDIVFVHIYMFTSTDFGIEFFFTQKIFISLLVDKYVQILAVEPYEYTFQSFCKPIFSEEFRIIKAINAAQNRLVLTEEFKL